MGTHNLPWTKKECVFKVSESGIDCFSAFWLRPSETGIEFIKFFSLGPESRQTRKTTSPAPPPLNTADLRETVAFPFSLKGLASPVTYELAEPLRGLVLTSVILFSNSSKAGQGLTGEHAYNTDVCAVENFRKGILFS